MATQNQIAVITYKACIFSSDVNNTVTHSSGYLL